MKYAGILNDCTPMQSHWDMNEVLLYLERFDIQTVVEIGCYEGGSLGVWSRALQPALVVGVTKDEIELVDLDRKVGDGPELAMVFGLSQQTATLKKVKQALHGNEIDFLFIDGGHSFKEVQNDFLMYSPLMAEEGVVGIHDLNQGAQDILKFWDGYIVQDYRSVRMADAALDAGLGIGLVLGSPFGTWAEQAARYDYA